MLKSDAVFYPRFVLIFALFVLILALFLLILALFVLIRALFVLILTCLFASLYHMVVTRKGLSALSGRNAPGRCQRVGAWLSWCGSVMFLILRAADPTAG